MLQILDKMKKNKTDTNISVKDKCTDYTACISNDFLPWVNVHKQHQRLHSYHVDAFTVKPCNFEHFQICYTQHDQREEEGKRVQNHGKNAKLHPGSLRPHIAESARCVKVVVTDPGATGGHC